MRDFTSKVYKQLIESILNAGYTFQTIEDFIKKPGERVVILRHDSDIWPWNDLNIAKIENKYNVKATYYFRIPNTFSVKIISEIRDLGHEIGYHYEVLSDSKGDFELARRTFRNNLEKIRNIYPVKTIVMHGRPLLKWDNRRFWDRYSLKDFGLIGEPYLSIDYNTVFYLTDNGSCWDGEKINIRDTVNSSFNYSFRTTFQLIEAFNKDDLPDKIILNAHAARWNDNLAIWMYRYFLQKAKNIVKYFFKICSH